MADDEEWDPFEDIADEEARRAEALQAQSQGKKATVDASLWYPEKPVVTGRPLRVACLHGTSSNSTILKMQLSRLKLKAKDKVEFIHIQGKFKSDPAVNVEVAQMQKDFPGQDFFQYMHCINQLSEDGILDYTGIEEAFTHVEEQMKANAPIDGIFGFSQGANLTPILAARSVVGASAPLAFVVVFGSSKGLAYPKRYPDLFSEPLKIPSFQCSMEKDWVLLPSGTKYRRDGEAARSIFVEPVCVWHSGDHRPLPPDREEADALAAKLLDWMLESAAA
eukprot:gnl/TRDRNA2_/TRDRNA2_54210_c0_seq1.p1 gnl/TRDRNA2_/TRDRNA2_54210_c0~~gnl/TRDRNA2_/TRDRNA2_54210_c0_seq1.p1  ORF type:complete len:278 (+),score=56.26 gnl/TRDRNA2_/TRDRNA2_54210_c0_seq1:80-913(+)